MNHGYFVRWYYPISILTNNMRPFHHLSMLFDNGYCVPWIYCFVKSPLTRDIFASYFTGFIKFASLKTVSAYNKIHDFQWLMWLLSSTNYVCRIVLKHFWSSNLFHIDVNYKIVWPMMYWYHTSNTSPYIYLAKKCTSI